MAHEFVLKNSRSAAVNTLPNTIIYLKAIKYFEDKTEIDLLTETNLEM